MARRRIGGGENSRPAWEHGRVWPNQRAARHPRAGTRHLLVGAELQKNGRLMRQLPDPEMLKTLRAAAHFFDRRIGWSRLGVALSLTIIIVAVVVLYRILRDIDPDSLLDAHRGDRLAHADHRRRLRRRRLSDADLLRPVRAAHDRPHRNTVPRRGAGRLHQLCGRPQCRRQRVLRRRRALSHLFGLGLERHRGHQDLLRRRADVLARQRHRARARRAVCAASGARHRSIAAVVQPRAGARDARHARRLCGLGLGQAARHRPRRLAGDAAGRAADASADRDRHRRSRLLRGGDVHAGARRAQSRLRHGGGDLRRRDAARLRQPRARRARRVRRRDDGGAVAVRQGRPAGRPAAVPAALLHHSVRDLAGDPRHPRIAARPRRARASAPQQTAPMQPCR